MTGTYDRARGKYRRAQFEKITQDEWITMLERQDERVEELEEAIERLQDELTYLEEAASRCDDRID